MVDHKKKKKITIRKFDKIKTAIIKTNKQEEKTNIKEASRDMNKMGQGRVGNIIAYRKIVQYLDTF